MNTATEAALQAKSVTPSITVNDLGRSITFYERLGFVITERWEDNGQLLGVMMGAGPTRLGLAQDDWKKGRDRVKGVGLRLWIGTSQDVDELAARARDAGIQLDAEPQDTEWGSRSFSVTDPDGFLLTVTTEP